MDSAFDRRGGALGLLAGSALGVAVGGVLGWFLHGREPDAAAHESASRAHDVAARFGEMAATRSGEEREAPGPAADASRAAEFTAIDRNSFDAELARRGRDGITAGWAQLRHDVIPVDLLDGALVRFQTDVASEPERLGRKLAEERTQQEAAAREGREFLELEKMKQGDEVDRKLVDEPDRFNSLFERRSGEITLDGTEAKADLETKLADGVTISFPAGVFQFGLAGVLQDLEGRAGGLPRDLTIAGAGIDRTLLVAGQGMRLHSPVRDWTIRDCTIFGSDELIACDGDASLTLDRIRVLGFDTGAGSSNALFLMGNVLRCRDSIFEGGYGRNPECGRLLDVRSGAMLARFERCRFTELAIDYLNSSWRIAFDGCHFEDLFSRGEHDGPGFPAGLVTTDCSFKYFDVRSAKPPKKDLKALFPDYDAARYR